MIDEANEKQFSEWLNEVKAITSSVPNCCASYEHFLAAWSAEREAAWRDKAVNEEAAGIS